MATKIVYGRIILLAGLLAVLGLLLMGSPLPSQVAMGTDPTGMADFDAAPCSAAYNDMMARKVHPPTKEELEFQRARMRRTH